MNKNIHLAWNEDHKLLKGTILLPEEEGSCAKSCLAG